MLPSNPCWKTRLHSSTPNPQGNSLEEPACICKLNSLETRVQQDSRQSTYGMLWDFFSLLHIFFLGKKTTLLARNGWEISSHSLNLLWDFKFPFCAGTKKTHRHTKKPLSEFLRKWLQGTLSTQRSQQLVCLGCHLRSSILSLQNPKCWSLKSQARNFFPRWGWALSVASHKPAGGASQAHFSQTDAWWLRQPLGCTASHAPYPDGC